MPVIACPIGPANCVSRMQRFKINLSKLIERIHTKRLPYALRSATYKLIHTEKGTHTTQTHAHASSDYHTLKHTTHTDALQVHTLALLTYIHDVHTHMRYTHT